MPLDLAQKVAQEFSQRFPALTYLALPREAGSVFCSGRDLCWDKETETYVKRLNVSGAGDGTTTPAAVVQPLSDSALKSLVHRHVFETRHMSMEVRRDALVGALKEMLPDHCRHVHVWAKASADRPHVFGPPHKGEAVFLEPEFGDHVYILLT